MSDMSDVDVITEAQTEKGSLALEARRPHNSPLRWVSNDMKMWQKAKWITCPDVTTHKNIQSYVSKYI